MSEQMFIKNLAASALRKAEESLYPVEIGLCPVGGKIFYSIQNNGMSIVKHDGYIKKDGLGGFIEYDGYYHMNERMRMDELFDSVDQAKASQKYRGPK